MSISIMKYYAWKDKLLIESSFACISDFLRSVIEIHEEVALSKDHSDNPWYKNQLERKRDGIE